MITKNIIITTVLLCNFNLATNMQAQGLDDALGGLQETFSKIKDDFENFTQDVAPDIKEALRYMSIFDKDIIMWMKAHDKGVDRTIKLKGGAPIGYFETATDNTMYGEYDSDNKAVKLHITDTGKGAGYTVGAFPIGNFDTTDNTQFIDKEGYWYVLVKFEGKNLADASLSGEKYVKFNAKQLAITGLNKMLDLNIDLMTDKLASELIGIASMIDANDPRFGHYDSPRQLVSFLTVRLFSDNNTGPYEYWGNKFEIEGDKKQLEIQKKLKAILKALLDKQNAYRVGFPVFFHWAFIYSPDLIKSQYDVTPTKLNCYRDYMPDVVCTKLTVNSGKEKGKFMIFDQYNRLVYIDSGKEGTVEYNYLEDVTVQLPKAITWDFLGSVEKGLSQEKRVDDAVEKKIEEIKSKELEEFLEYINFPEKYIEIASKQKIGSEEQKQYDKQKAEEIKKKNKGNNN